jgi:long-chain acyl-CoA synthetase
MAHESEIKYSKSLSSFLEEDKNKLPETLGALLEYIAGKYGDGPAVGKAFETPMSYNEFLNRSIQVTRLLTERGVVKGDRVAILGENSPNWGISFFAIVRLGAIAVPILPDFPDADIRHILTDSEAKVLFTTCKQYDKIADFENVKLKHIIMLDDFTACTNPNVELLTDIFDKAIDLLKKIPESMGLLSKKIEENDIASIIYTSGTSGHSKAVMLTHRNLIANVAACTLLADIGSDDVFLSILPMSHCYEFTIGFLLPLLSGSKIMYLGKPPTPRILEEVCKKEKPSIICSVPLVLEKIYKKKVLPVIKKNLAIRLITRIPGLKKKIYAKINRKLLEFFGDRFRLMAVGGASFNREAEKFFRTAGFPFLVGYGLTESSPLLAGGPFGDKTIRLSSTGKVTPGCEIKIVDPDKKTGIGEIVARGQNVMKGYYKNPELTAAVLDKDGWLNTGDLGYIDKNDNLHIKGRSKNMILMSNGENIYPEVIEEKLNASLYVVESLVIERNSRLDAWIYLDYDLVDRETKGKTESQRFEYIKRRLNELKEEVNEQLSSFSKLSRVIEQEEPFVKTATHKIKRYLYTHPEK